MSAMTTPQQRSAHTRKARARLTTDQRQAFDQLRDLLPIGATVYNVLDGSPSASGMSRKITSYAMKDNAPRYITGLMCIAFPDTWTRAKTDGRYGDSVRVHGCGMDMGFDLAYTLSRLLHGDGYALNHRWL